MKHIIKNQPPEALLKYQKTQNASYDGCPGKEWSESLLEEQGHLCAYTMQRISLGKMKREHFLSRSKYPELELDHQNVLGVCLGNQGKNFRDTYADTRKGDRELICIDPRRIDCEKKIAYRKNGEIRIEDPALARELLDDPAIRHLSILNLNHSVLVSGRKRAYEGVIRRLTKLSKGKAWKHRDIEKMIERYKTRDADGKYQEYCMFVLFRLKREFTWRKAK